MVRFKQRYLVVEVHSAGPDGLSPLVALVCDAPAASAAAHIRASLAAACGSATSSAAAPSLAVKYCNLATGTAVVRVAREHAPAVWAALTLLRTHPGARIAAADPGASEGGAACVWRVRHVAGTLRSAQRRVALLAARSVEARMRDAPADVRARLSALLSACRAEIRAMDA